MASVSIYGNPILNDTDTPSSPESTLQKFRQQLAGDLFGESEPSFTEPWQAQAFALAVHLIGSGHITWSDWSATLGDEIANAGSHGIREDGSEYYLLWLRALERLVSEKALVPQGELKTLATDWKAAYLRTPHGLPVALPEEA